MIQYIACHLPARLFFDRKTAEVKLGTIPPPARTGARTRTSACALIIQRWHFRNWVSSETALNNKCLPTHTYEMYIVKNLLT